MGISREKLIAGFTGAAMLLGVSGTAIAADGQPYLLDARQKSEIYMKHVGGAASVDGQIAIVVKGGDKELLTDIWLACVAAEKNWDRDLVFIRANDDKPDDKKVEVDIYIANQHTDTWNISDRNKTHLEQQLNALIDGGIKRTVAAETASLNKN